MDQVSAAVPIGTLCDIWFEALVRMASARNEPLTQARAYGDVLSRLMDVAQARQAPGRFDWMDWERQKTLRLLRSAM